MVAADPVRTRVARGGEEQWFEIDDEATAPRAR